MILHNNKEYFADAIRATAEMMGIAPEFVEKDYWICQILQKLSRHPKSDLIVWKGGTSLSKAYNLIQRFSSDVDFAILSEELSQNQLRKLISKVSKDITIDLSEKIVEGQTHKNNRYRKTYHEYESTIKNPSAQYKFLGNHVIVEINTYGNPFPYVDKEVRTFIANMMEQKGLSELIEVMDMKPFSLHVLDKRCTLTEKTVSLLRYSFDEDPIHGLSSKIRHFYDLHYLIQDPECKEFINKDFPQKLVALIKNDKFLFDRPQQWKKSDLFNSRLLVDLEKLWQELSPKYNSELGALAFNEIPNEKEILESIKELFDKVVHAIIITIIQNSK